MINKLTKDTNISISLGSPYVPADPGQPYIPPHTVVIVTSDWVLVDAEATQYVKVPASEYQQGSGDGGEIPIYSDANSDVGYGGMPSYYLVPLYPPYGGHYEYQTVYRYEWSFGQPYIPPTPAQPAVGSQVLQDMNIGWNAGAVSIAQLEGNGGFKFKASNTAAGIVAGICDTQNQPAYPTIAFGFEFANGIAYVVERGQRRLCVGPYALADVWGVFRSNGLGVYTYNGATVYVGTELFTDPAVLGVCMYAGGDYVFDPQPASIATSVAALQPLTGIGGRAYAQSEALLQPLISEGRVGVRSEVSLQPLEGLGADRAYAAAAAAMYPLKGSATGGFPKPAYSFSAASLSFMTAGGHGLTGEVGQSLTFLPLPVAIASDHEYGFSATSMAPLRTRASAFEGNAKASLGSVVAAHTWMTSPTVLSVTFSAGASIATLISSDLCFDADLYSAVEASVDMALSAVLGATMNSAVLAGFGVPIFDSESVTYVVDDRTQTTRYEGYGFNSFAKFDGHYFGLRTDGIYLLEGDTDSGEPIRASINFGSQSMGNDRLKGVSNCYLGVSSTDKLFLKVTTDTQEYVYVARSFSEQLKQQRVDIGRGLRANYFTFELYNQDGCDLELASVEFVVATTNRRI